MYIRLLARRLSHGASKNLISFNFDSYTHTSIHVIVLYWIILQIHGHPFSGHHSIAPIPEMSWRVLVIKSHESIRIVNWWWPSNAIGRHGPQSILTAPSHYLNEMYFIICRVRRIHLIAITMELLINVVTTPGLKITHIKWKPHPQENNGVNLTQSNNPFNKEQWMYGDYVFTFFIIICEFINYRCANKDTYSCVPCFPVLTLQGLMICETACDETWTLL